MKTPFYFFKYRLYGTPGNAIHSLVQLFCCVWAVLYAYDTEPLAVIMFCALVLQHEIMHAKIAFTVHTLTEGMTGLLSLCDSTKERLGRMGEQTGQSMLKIHKILESHEQDISQLHNYVYHVDPRTCEDGERDN